MQPTTPQPQEVVVKHKGPGCLKLLGLSCGMQIMGCLGLIAAAIAGCIIVAVVIGFVEKASTERAVERNEGRGTLEEPIAAEVWMKFKNGDIRATRLIRPADAMVEGFSVLNNESPAGADYVLVWFEIRCDTDRCFPRLDVDLHLIDAGGRRWGEPWLIVLDDDLDGRDAVRGGTIEGWQAFEFPTGNPIQAIRVKWGPEILHAQVPPGG